MAAPIPREAPVTSATRPASGRSQSSVVIPAEQIGFEAARLLDEMLQGRTVPAEPLLLPPELERL